MAFPSDIKLAMRECIFKVLWPKDDIMAFFEANSCSKSDIKSIGDYKSMNRYMIVDTMLDKKIKAAQTKGLIYVDARTGKSKT